MEYYSYGNRCAVDLNAFNLPISHEEALKILEARGHHQIHINFKIMTSLLRELIGYAKYKRGAGSDKAPDFVDCSSLTQWIYRRRGINIARYSIQQRNDARLTLGADQVSAGDLVFTTGRQNYYEFDPRDNVGHVGFATEDGTVIHASNEENGVIETPFTEFFEQNPRGIRRIITNDEELITLESAVGSFVRSSEEFKWIIRQSLPMPS
jgi:hypothetical protein